MDKYYEITEKGAEVLLDILDEFFHGFTFSEVLNNNTLVDENMVRMLFYALFAQAGFATPIPAVDDDAD